MKKLSKAAGEAEDQARTSAILEVALDCVITMDSAGRVIEFNPAAERTFGYRRSDVLGRQLAELIVPPALREQHRAGIARYLKTGEARVLGRRVELDAMRADGSEFPVELAITRIPGHEPPLFTAYLRDISARVRAERLRNIRFAVTQVLNQAADIPTAASAVLRAVCEQLHWDFGAFWSVDPGGQALECTATWTAGEARMSAFDEASRGRTFTRHEGLPGRCWASASAEWVLDVRNESNFPRRAQALGAGLKSAFACPVIVGEQFRGVIEFFTQNLRPPDAELLETMGTVAGHVGQFIERHQAERRLRESEARFRALMEQAPFSMQIFSPDGRTLRVNPAWSELWGVTLEQIGDYNVLADPQLEEKGVLPWLRRAFAGEAVDIPPIRYDPNVTIPERSAHVEPSRYVSAVAYPLKDNAGRVQEVVLVHEDITARRQAETALRESEEKLRLLADTIPQLAWMAHPDGNIFWYNRRWYEYTGTKPADMEGWGWQSVHDPEVLPEVLTRWKASIATGEPFDMVFPLKSSEGTFRPFLTRVNPLRDEGGRILYWFGTNTDISEMKRMEDALRQSDRRKDEFLATLAHELRNPLAPIVNSLQILKLAGVDAATAREARDRMERQVRHLVRLVDDLLDISRIVRGKVELRRERVDLGTVVARALEIAQPLIDARRHRLEISLAKDPVFLDADPIRLAQVIGNLLTNAAKYSDADGRISLSTHASGDEAVVCVADDGIGIAPELMPRVFEPFVQGDQAAVRSPGGLGIGLSLVKALVELHGGVVEAYSAGRAKGARFTIRLPRLPDGHHGGGTQSATSPVTRIAPARRILVVDDNKDAAESLAALLRLQGHDLHIAYDGESAVKIARDFRPAIVFLDIGMPGMDGYETARRIRALPGREKIVLVALTGWGQEEDRRRSSAAGFDRHLVKPTDSLTVERILDEVL